MKKLIPILAIIMIAAMSIVGCPPKTTDEVEKFQQLKSDSTAINYDGIYPPHSETVSP